MFVCLRTLVATPSIHESDGQHPCTASLSATLLGTPSQSVPSVGVDSARALTRALGYEVSGGPRVPAESAADSDGVCG